jgi:G3E family GTPase
MLTYADVCRWARSSEAYRQIAHATTLAINKTDLANGLPASHSLQQLEALVRKVNPHAHLVRCMHADLDLDLILNQVCVYVCVCVCV